MMDFYHPLMQKWIPSTILITEKEYLTKFECKKCKKDREKYKDDYYLHKLETDIFFDVYYWLRSDSKSNTYAYSYSEAELMDYFKCKRDQLVDYAREIGMDKLVKLCTYHSLWLHYDYHWMCKSGSGDFEEWDTMVQSKHVHAKNEIHHLIYLLLSCSERKELMQEIRDFTLVPPRSKNGVSGYDYRRAKENFEQMEMIKDKYFYIK